MSDKKKGIAGGITKNVFVLGIVSFLTDVSTEMVYPIIPLFLTTVLGAGTAFVGLVEGIAESTASILKLFSGWLSDKLDKRKSIVVIGYTLSSLTRPLIAISTAAWHILVIRFIDRVGKGVRTSPRDALIADSTDCRSWGKAFGFHRSMDHLGAVVGPLLAFLFLYCFKDNYRGVFWLATIPAIICVIVLVAFVSEKKHEIKRPIAPVALTLKPFSRRFRYLLLIILIFTLGNSSDAFLILRAKGLGVSVALIPIIWVVLHIVKSLSSTPGGILSDKLGRKNVIILGWLIYGLAYLGFGFAAKAYQAWLLFAFYGIYFGLTEGVEKALVTDLVPTELRGTAFGFYNFVIGIAALPASLILGVLWQTVGCKIAFSFGAFLALIAMVMLFFLMPGSEILRKASS